MNPALKTALVKFARVMAWAVCSALASAVPAYFLSDPRWLALAPFINALAASVKKYLDEHKNFGEVESL